MTRPVTPPVAADIIIELIDRPGRPIVLIERRYEPFGWAIPGGFVDVGETVEAAAVREALEETCMQVSLVELLGVYSDPERDPRGQTISLVYIARATGEPEAADDAANLAIFEPGDFPSQLAFDHDRILKDYMQWRHSEQAFRSEESD